MLSTRSSLLPNWGHFVPFVAFDAIVDGEPGLVPDHVDLGVFDCRQAVGDHRQAGNAERHGAQDVAIVQRHLEAFVEVLVVHVVDAVHRVHIGAREPFHHAVELFEHLVVVEHVAGDRRRRRRDLIAGDFVAPAVDGVEQRLCEVHAGAEELHLLAELHRRHAAGDAVVVAPVGPHQVVVLVLQRGRLAADLDAVALEVLRQVFRPEHRDVRLRRRPEIGQRVQHAIAALGHERLAVQIDAADTFGRPVGVAAEQRVIFGRAKEAHDAELLDQLVPELLRAGFVQRAFLEVALDEDVEEARNAADRHRRAVRFLDGAEIGQIRPLHRFLRVCRRARDVAVIELRHCGQVFQRADLVGQLLAHADHFVGRPHVVDLRAFLPLGLIRRSTP